jgi:RNA polymerase sigma factor (sigma-70 family)
MRLPIEEETTLIARSRQGDRAAFDTLYAACEPQVNGFVRSRTRDDHDVQQIVQNTRLIVWEKIPIYDPSRARFTAFTKYWAGLMLLRYYAEQQQRHRLEVLFSELQARYADLEQETEISAVLARVAVHRNPSVEDETLLAEEEQEVDVEVYNELLRITFSGASPPHQLMAFGFKLLPGESPQETWKPQKVVAELSALFLRILEEKLEYAYVQTSQLPEARVRCHFERLRQSMDRTLDEVVTERRTRQTYASLLGSIVGGTILQQYYTHTDDPAQDISHWWEAVKRRVWRDVKQQGARRLLILLQEAERREKAPKRQGRSK